MLDADTLAACLGCKPATAAAWFPPLWSAMRDHRISSPRRILHFLTQVAHESAGLERVVERMTYSADRLVRMGQINGPRSRWGQIAQHVDAYAGKPEALANAVYSGRNGNGDEASGDGWRFRGRGPLCLTGRANYAHIGASIGVDLVADPDAVALPGVGSRAACAFWTSMSLNRYADDNNIAAVSRVINFGTAATNREPIGMQDRRACAARIAAKLGIN